MLAFIDESGHPHPKDSSTRPVVLAVCINDDLLRNITGLIYRIKRQILNKELMEMKGVNLINRGTFRRIPEKREFVETFFDQLRNLPITILGIVMERPIQIPPQSPMLPSQFRFLLERINLLAEDTSTMATVLFDGDGKSQYGGLAVKFSNYLHRSLEGQSLTHITDAPFFVDSSITSGIQIADMAASVVRQYQENNVFRGLPQGDAYLNAIRRYYAIIESKTVDQISRQGYPRHGLYRMPEREHYAQTVEATSEERP